MTDDAGRHGVRHAPGRCLLCGAGNGCGAATGANRCWCADAKVDSEVERWLLGQAIDDRCLCRQCLTGAVPSPCVSICELDPSGERCLGCHRTLHEIGGWAAFSVTQKVNVWRRIHEVVKDGGQ